MKKILYICTLFCVIMLAGCDDLLDVTPGSELTDDGFWKSAKDFEGACNKLYYDLGGWSNDTRADELVGKSSDDISSGNSTIKSGNSNWKNRYSYIYVANNIIDKGLKASVAESVRDRWLAEAYFFRAYHYFELVKKYGDVPLILKIFTSTSDPDLKMGRTPRETVIQQCYTDLEFAIKYLPDHKDLPTSELGRRRVSTSSALGMIVRIGLYEGTFRKYHGGNDAAEHLKKSINAFERLDAKGYHKLFEDFNEVFSYKNEANNVNREIIFGKPYGENDFATVTTGHMNTRELEGNFALTRNILDLFLYADGLPMSKTALKVEKETSMNNIVGLDTDGNPLPNDKGQRDPRLLKTIWTFNDAVEYESFMGWSEAGKGKYHPFDSQRPKGYICKKAFFGSMWSNSLGNKDFTDKILIRYAEMLVSYAEALYELNGSITDAQLDATINKLRERVGFNIPLTNDFVTKNGLDMLEEIRRERTVELMAEGFRYDDIIRWKTAEKVLPVAMIGPYCSPDEVQTTATYEDSKKRLTDSEGKIDGTFAYDQQGVYVIEYANTRKFNPKRDYLYPIPTDEIAYSDDNITQNPEW
ncbi:RagB/SusD family nutrient uptake outer membrane protein [Bacteroides sp. 519]|uniref:RagB/SusD family nutrient uptake outer membrane protein n=1 Tax=Bacteroides sp. 519 TaxID=2302937 RepID=UPI0013D32DDE|nr:RagB/SusD family nutrient uptake outer membrane protein [Bacteroides sp. 519]NDV57993.1 RagB/SusD family nutrient uptake outer membrane protein [Bacteroides sp. 519]